MLFFKVQLISSISLTKFVEIGLTFTCKKHDKQIDFI